MTLVARWGRTLISERQSASTLGAWDHPGAAVCDGRCAPTSDLRELWHHRDPVVSVLTRNRDRLSGYAFRDDTISAAGIQSAGEVGWRLQLNGEVVDAGLEETERVLAEQLERVREVISALSKVPQPRTG